MPWADEAEQQLSRISRSGWELSGDIRIFGVVLLEETGRAPIPGLLLKFEGSRQASSPSLCASVRAGPWADEAEQQLSRLAPSGCHLSGDVRIFGEGMLEKCGRDTLCYI